MSSRSDASIIIGISMGQETCQILGQASHNLLCWKKNLPKDSCGPERDWRENSLHPGQIIYGQSSGSQWKSTPSRRRSKSGRMKSSILENARKLRVIYFIDFEDKEFKETIKNARKKLESPMAPAMPCKITKKNCGSGHPTRSKQDLHVFWKLIHCNITTWFTGLFLCLKLWKFPKQKQRWTRNGKIGETFGVEPDESQK